MSDWTTARVVRDSRGRMLLRADSGRWLWQDYDDGGHASFPTVQVATFGPLVPVLDTDGLPVVRTVGDLTARHLGRRVRVETDRTLPDRVRLLREIATASNEAARLTLEVIDHPEWFLMASFTLDTPCDLLPEGDA